MKKANKVIIGAVALLTLSSCGVALKETFPGPVFQNPNFEDNYYEVFPNELKVANDKETITVNVDSPGVTYYKNLIDDPDATIDLMIKDAAKYGDKMNSETKTIISYYLTEAENYRIEKAIYDAAVADPNVPNPETAPTAPNKISYTNNYYKATSLGKVDNSFRNGYFSKLTDGITFCGGNGAGARIQAKEAGFGEVFQKELIEYTTLLIAFRGGTNVDWGANGIARVTSAKIELNIDFYIENTDKYDRVRLSFEAETFTDSASSTNLLHIDLGEFLKEQPDILKRMRGVSFTYKLLEHEYLKPDGVDAGHDEEFGLLVYEFALPYSVWN